MCKALRSTCPKYSIAGSLHNVSRTVCPHPTHSPLLARPSTANSSHSSTLSPHPDDSQTLRKRHPSILHDHFCAPHDPQPSPQWLPQTPKEAPIPESGYGWPAGDEGRLSQSRHHQAQKAQFWTKEDCQGQTEQREDHHCLHPW